MQARGGTLETLGLVDGAATHRHLPLQDVASNWFGLRSMVRVSAAGLVELVFLQQEAGALEVQFGVFRGQQHGAADCVLGGSGVAVGAFGVGQQRMGLGVVRGACHGHAGQRQGFGVGAAPQGGENSFLHGSVLGLRGLGPEPSIVPSGATAPGTPSAGRSRIHRRGQLRRDPAGVAREFGFRKPQCPPIGYSIFASPAGASREFGDRNQGSSVEGRMSAAVSAASRRGEENR